MTYIVTGKRSAIGNFMGHFKNTPAPELAAEVLKNMLKETSLETKIEEIFMGCVLTSGIGQAPARQVGIKAGLPLSIPAQTIGKVCGSGLQAIVNGHLAIKSGHRNLVVAGGMENMSLAPHLAYLRNGVKYGDTSFTDCLALDGLSDAYSKKSMGACAQQTAEEYKLTREEQDLYAINSFKRALKAQEEKVFSSEIVSVQGLEEDEGPKKVKFEKIPTLRPAFSQNGTITAANSSTLNDGAAVVLLAGEEFRSLAEFKILGVGTRAITPENFVLAPIESINLCLNNSHLKVSDIDFWEINEAFACVPLLAIKQLNLNVDKVNVRGGAIALGHPIGATGARLLVTLMNTLSSSQGAKIGMVSLCIGGGEALTVAIERL